MLFRASSILRSHPWSLWPLCHPRLSAAVQNNMSPWRQCGRAWLMGAPWKSAVRAIRRKTWRTNSPAVSECGLFWRPTPPLAWLRRCRPLRPEPECPILDLSSGMDKGTCRSLLPLPPGSDTGNASKTKRSRRRSGRWGKWANTKDGPPRTHPFLKRKWTLV